MPTKITPTFNPTGAPESEIFARGRRLNPSLDLGWKPHADFDSSADAIPLWRLEQRSRVESGLGLIASRISLHNSLGDFNEVELFDHMGSTHDKRLEAHRTTPFVSFSNDPHYIASELILRRGFGIKDDAESVVVSARVDPDRLISPGPGKHREILLVGGLAPEEYVAGHDIGEFVREHVAPDEMHNVMQIGPLQRDAALAHWQALHPNFQR